MQTSQERGAYQPPALDALARAGYRSVFARVETWVWCPHCGLKIDRDALKPVRSLEAKDGAPLWHAVTCPRCHARGRVRPLEESD